jgi:cytochrome c oxidase assembly factor CtaG/polyferredoxin
MESLASAALTSWTLDARALAILLLTAFLYVRGWLRGRTFIRDERDFAHLASFLGGLLLVFLATESPLDAFDSLFLSAHMTQHLLLMMFAPPLVLLGSPFLPMLRGLPKTFVKEGLAPFLTWRPLKQFFGWLTSPPVAWAAFVLSSVIWHLPFFYELALSSPTWHGVQHASFFWSGILFWWPIIQPGPGKQKWPVWVAIPYLLFGDIVNTVIAAFFVFSGTLLYPSYAMVRAGSMTALEDQSLAGLIMWVPGSIVYLVPAFVFMGRLVSGQRRREIPVVRVRKLAPRVRSKFWSSAPQLRRIAQWGMLLLAAVVMADGFRGTQVAPLNLAGVLPWIHWRALSILALLVVGNVFCMACPFTLARDIARRILPAKLRWPRGLRTKWLAAALFVLYLWAYEAFSLWDSPWLTACVMAGYFLAAIAVDGVFRGASFCKYVCPIGQYHFVGSLISPREIGIRSEATCQSCRTYDCIRGNTQTRGCELALFQPRKIGNLDCTFCLDCVKACPHDNVALLPVIPAKTITFDGYRSSIGRLAKRNDWAALALLFVFGAFVNAAGMLEPVMQWEHGWHARLGPHAMPLIVAAFVVIGVVAVPSALVASMRLWQSADTVRRLVFMLVPLGFSMWAAHLLYHVAQMPLLPDWLTGAQILLLNAGLLLTLYMGWRIQDAVRKFVPWALTACLLYGAGIWILFQPMEMRGMMH